MPEPYGSGTVDIGSNIIKILKAGAFRGSAAKSGSAEGLAEESGKKAVGVRRRL